MKNIQKRKYIYVIVNIGFGGVMISFFIFSLVRDLFFFPVLFMLLIGLWIVLSCFWYKKWIKEPFKLSVIKPCIESIHKGIIYQYKQDSENYKRLIKYYGLIPMASSFDFNDWIMDSLDGISYVSFDLLASHQVQSGKNSHRVIDFQGKVYDILLGKTECDFILKEEGKRIKPEAFVKVELESIDMNDRFDLYTNDTLQIFKIFTPKQIKRCRALHFFDNSKSVICWLGEHLYIFLSNCENQFERYTSEAGIKREYFLQLENLKKYLAVFWQEEI